MSLGHRVFGVVTIASFFMGLSTAACSDSSSDGGGRDGVGGSSGAGVTGGTAGSAGAMSTGGTGSGASSCATYCQRRAACAEPPLSTCQADCERDAGYAEDLGCAVEYQAALDCYAAVPDVCAEDACEAELAALFGCAGDSGMAGCAPAGTGPASADCVAVCQRFQMCPGGDATECATSCAEGAAQAEMFGCSAERDRYNGCLSTCTNPCVATTADCSEELLAYTDCLICGAQPSNPNCGI